jgi:acyl-CoA synthetase (NDP forming)
MEFHRLNSLFHPKSVAVVGASSNPLSGGHHFTRYLVDDNFKGKIYPVNPNLNEIFGLKVYPSLKAIPEPEVDYVICCIRAESVLQFLDDCYAKNVKLIHLFTARMKETGRDEKAKLEYEILKKAKSFGIRLLGPNCMGIYHPKIGLSFNHDLPMQSGFVGGFFQSGGGAGEFVRYAALRGVRFSKVVSYGNALDIDECELLHYFAQDHETKIIAAYIEGVKDGRKFMDALSYVAKRKPVVLLKGGRGKAGSRSTLSHTGSLAGSMEIWRAVLRQCGAIEVSNFQELVDQVVAFSFLPPITGRRVVIAGGGGGKSVISADVWEEEGFQVPDLPSKAREKLREQVPELWDWLRNPIDVSILQGVETSPMELLRMVSEVEKFDVLVANITQDDPIADDIWKESLAKDFLDGVLRIKKEGKPIISVIETGEVSPSDMENWKWKTIAEVRKNIVREGIPVFPSPYRAAKALRRLIDHWENKRGNE